MKGKATMVIFRNKKALLAISGTLLLISVFVFAIQRTIVNASTEFETEALVTGNISTSVEATGTVRAYQSATLVWKTKGVVESVDVSQGDVVSAGDVLATLDRSSLSQQIIGAEAALITAERTLEDLNGSAGTKAANAAIALYEAQEAYDDAVNYRALLDDEVKYDVFAGWTRLVTPFGTFRIPKIDNIRYYPDEEQKAEADQDIALQKALLDDAQREYDRVKDGPNERDVVAAEAEVMAAQAVLDLASIIVPFDSVITSVDLHEGDQVSPGEQAFRVDNLSSLLIDLNVSEVDINSISVGQTVSIDFDAIQTKFYQGTVIEIAGASSWSQSGTSFRVTIELVDADEQIRPGMTADVVIQVREIEDALLIPNRAIRMLNGERVVYILHGDEPVPVQVRLGSRAESYSEVVYGDLQVGDLIVLNPPANIE
jgi:HlyD family secretion protein